MLIADEEIPNHRLNQMIPAETGINAILSMNPISGCGLLKDIFSAFPNAV